MDKLQIPISRGYVNDTYGDGLIIKNEYLVFSLNRGKCHFLNYKEPSLNGFDSEFLHDLEQFNFWLSISHQEKYWNDYLKKGHIISKMFGYPEWVGRSILTNSKEEVEFTIEKVKQNLESVCTNRKDIFIRIQSLIPCPDVPFPSTDNLKHIYAYCNVPYNGNKLNFIITIDRVEFLSDQKLGCKIFCEVNFIQEEKLPFEVYVFTPEYFSIPLSIESGIFPPHIIVDHLDISNVQQYLLNTLALIKASSKLELILKLGIFTDSFLGMDFVKKRLYHDLEYKFEPVYFDNRL